MTNPILWDSHRVAEYIIEHGSSYARIKSPRGYQARIKRLYGTILGKCFRNSFHAALNSNDSMYYCEGFARVSKRHQWTPHAWCVYKDPDKKCKEENRKSYWALDLTWPWIHKGRVYDDVEYVGVCFEPLFVHEFLMSVKHFDGDARVSVFRHIDRLNSYSKGICP